MGSTAPESVALAPLTAPALAVVAFGRTASVVNVSSSPVVTSLPVVATTRKWYVVLGCRPARSWATAWSEPSDATEASLAGIHWP